MRRAQKKVHNQALGRSRGGLSTKIYAACDGLGNPIRFLLTGGEVSDYTQALLADKGYDADYVVKEAQLVESRGGYSFKILL